jgi:hypothetical protein
VLLVNRPRTRKGKIQWWLFAKVPPNSRKDLNGILFRLIMVLNAKLTYTQDPTWHVFGLKVPNWQGKPS